MKSGNSLSNSDTAKTEKISPSLFFEGRGDSSEKIRTPNNLSQKEFNAASNPKIVILGVGNLLLSDEGVGVHVANELMKMDMPSNVLVVEGGTDGFRLLNVIIEADRLIVIDAVKGGAEPGTIYRFDIREIGNVPSGFQTSFHQIGILDVIKISGLIGKTPYTTVIGIEPKTLEMGMDLSPEIKEKVPRIIELVIKELQN